VSAPVRIGVDLGGTKIEAVALAGSDERARMRVDTPRDDYAATVEAVASLVEAVEARTRLRGSVGVGIPGTLSPSTGLVKNANSVWLIGQPLLNDLERRLGRPVRIANDANCLAASEAADGAAAGCGVVFAAILGTGVGAGLVVGGQVLTGANGIAGEWGHNPLPWATDDERPGPACYCGQRGCIESFLSGPALSGDVERRSGVRMLPPDIVTAAGRGDAEADGALTRYEHRLARALASIINVIDPDVIVLGGGMSNVDRLYTNVPTVWDSFVFNCGGPGRSPVAEPHDAQSLTRTRLVRARHGDSSGVRGAAWLWNS
jgi:fructokinase